MSERVCVSFKKNEVSIYEYLSTKKDKSCFIKELIEREMQKEQGGIITDAPEDKKAKEKAELVENEYDW